MGLVGQAAHLLRGDTRHDARGDRTPFRRDRVASAASEPVEIWFRSPGGRRPDVLEIGLIGRRRPRVEAYWDGLRMAV